MASTILFKRSNTSGNDAYTGFLGEVTIDTQARKLRVHDGVQVGGFVVSNMDDLNAVVDRIDGLQISDIAGLEDALAAINARLDTLETNYIKKDGSVAFTGNVDAGNNQIKNVAYPNLQTDGANKQYVDDEISSLGNVFSYEGDVNAGAEATPFDLSTLGETGAGSYYSIATAGWVTDGAATDPKVEYVNVNDSIVFNTVGSYKVVDNTNSEISGTTDFISVSGNPDTGYTVDVHQTFKGRLTAIESDTVYGVTGNAPITVNNTDPQNPIIDIDNVTQTADGAMSKEDKVKIDGIEANAQVNTVTSVNGYVGAVNLVKSDVGLNNVDNYATANVTESTDGNSTSRFVTPQGVRNFVEDGTYTIDGGTF